MKIALAQMDVKANMPERNLETMLSMIEDAKEQNVDIIAFPEMAVGGYLVGDKFLEDSFCENLMEIDEELRRASAGIAIVYGNVYLDHDFEKRTHQKITFPNQDGRIRRYNAIRAWQNGSSVPRTIPNQVFPEGVQPKTLLPNYRIFDDKRYFKSILETATDLGIKCESLLLSPFAFDIKGEKKNIGLELCEDLWSDDYRRNGKMLSPTQTLIDNGAEAIINISASPWTYGKNSARDRRVQSRAKEIGNAFVPFLYVNLVGAQNNGKNIVTFDGGSTVYDSCGEPVAFAKEAYQQELMIVDNVEAFK